MKKYLILIFLFIFISLLVPALTKAHSMDESNDVSVLFHIDPNDNPAASSKSRIFLLFESEAHESGVENCECTLEVVKDNKSLTTFNLQHVEEANHEFVVDYVFPTKGTYTLHVFGKKDGTSFDIDHELEVENGTLNTQTMMPVFIALTAVLLLLLFFRIQKNLKA